MSMGIAIEDPILTPLSAANHEVDRLPKLGMKGMGDTYRGGHFYCMTCSWYAD